MEIVRRIIKSAFTEYGGGGGILAYRIASGLKRGRPTKS
jgi:hypothetical protein